VVWRPDLHTYSAHLMSKVNGSAPVNAKMNNADLPKIVGQGLGKAIQLWQEDVHVSDGSGVSAARSQSVVDDMPASAVSWQQQQECLGEPSYHNVPTCSLC
jgi:hypothetical protein